MIRQLRFAQINPFYLLLLFGYGATRLIERITGTTETWNVLWHKLTPYFDQQKFLSYIIGLPLIVIVVHWMLITISVVFNRLFKTADNRQYKKERTKLAGIVLINQLFFLPLTMIFNLYIMKFLNESNTITFASVPSFPRMFYRLFVSMIMYEVVNFYLHWMLHHPLIYKQILKPSYSITGTLGVANVFQYPVEYILLNVLPPSIAMSFSRCDSVTIIFFLAAIMIGPFFEHYSLLPILFNNENHEYHYQYCSDCCGANSNGMFDFIYGSYDRLSKTKYFENHRILLSMKSLERRCDE